jgi:hypothetical protein
MLEPKTIEIDGKLFIISKFPVVAGREIITQYPLSGIPKLGDYKTNESLMLKIMSYVAIPMGEGELCLSTQVLIDNHVGSWETLIKLEMAMMEYNCSFFQSGRVSSFLEDSAKNLPAWITETLMPLLRSLFQKDSPHTKNSKKSIR